MRMQRRNERKLFYSLFNAKTPITYTDSEGNTYETGEYKVTYLPPVEFKGSLAMSGAGYSEPMEFGLDLSDYNATLIVDKDSLPITETSIIWFESTPEVDAEGYAVKESADYSVIKVNKSLNVDKFVLKKLVQSYEQTNLG